MSLNFTVGGDHLQLSGLPPITAPPFAFGCRYNVQSIAAGRRFMSLGNTSQATEYMYLGLNPSSASGELSAVVKSASAGFEGRAKSSIVVPGAWESGVANFASTFTRECERNGANKGTDTGTQAPAGINVMVWSGRPLDFVNGSNSLMAVTTLFNRALTDVEKQHWGAFGHPRSLTATYEYWELSAKASTQVGELRGLIANATGTTTGASDPDCAPHYIGAPIGDLSLQQGVAIAPIHVSAAFDTINSPCSYALWQIGAQTATTTTSAASAAATRTVPVTSSAAFSTGDFATVGGGAPARVLAVLVAAAAPFQLLLDTDQTFSSGATVARLPAAPATVGGLGLSAGDFVGAPTGTQTSAAGYFFLATCSADPTNPSKAAASNRFAIAVAAIPVAPSFQVTPHVTQRNSDGYVVGFTPAGTPCTAYIGFYKAGSIAPTIPQLKAGSGTGYISSSSKTSTGADSMTGAGLDFPNHDIHMVLNNAQGDSQLFSLLAEQKGPPVGRVYRLLSAPAAGTPYVGNAVAGDIEETDAVVSPAGAAIALRADGNESFIASARQRRTARVYSVSGKAWLLDDASQQNFNVWYNDTAPVFAGGPSVAYVLPLNTAITPIPLTSLFQSQDGAQQVITALDALPTGLSVVNNQVVGTATVGGIFKGKRLRSTDLAGATGDGAIGAYLIGSLHPPNLFSLDYRDAIQVVTGAFFVPIINFVDYDGPPNVVLSQDPPTSASVQPLTPITLNVSRTPAGRPPKYGLQNHSFRVVPQADGDLDLNHPDGSG